MKQKIKDVAEIQIGYQFRGRVESDPHGMHKVIQIRDLDDLPFLKVENLQAVKLKGDTDRYLVNENDVLFLSRGHKNYAIPINIQLKNTIAASYFFILRIKQDKILPDYLAWYLNQAPAQEYLHSVARRGTHMPLVPLSAFNELTVDVPDIVTQKRIVEVSRLLEKENYLAMQLQEKRSQLVKATCLKAAKKKEKTE
jgi:restriction endonuclease S subunit